jgi:hypothetical protein
LLIDFENILIPNDLIIVRNHGDDEYNVGESFRGVEDQQGHPIQVGDQFNSELQSATLNPTRSPKPPCNQIDAQDTYAFRFGHSIYAWKHDKITFPMA